MNIRKMLISDYEKVYDLWMSCKNMGFNDLDDSKAGVKKFLDRNPNTSFVAEEENKIIGIILSGHDGRRGYIYHVCVREECRNKKIGSQLVSKSLEALKNEGINKVALLVFNKNEIGNALLLLDTIYNTIYNIYMAKWAKLLEKIESLDKDMRFTELRKVLESYGYTVFQPKRGSSHYTFRKPGCNPITIPNHEPIKVIYVRMVKDVVEAEANNKEV